MTDDSNSSQIPQATEEREDDEMLDEYDFSQGVRGKYAKKLQQAKEVTIKITRQESSERSE
jgi:hypothetical protein